MALTKIGTNGINDDAVTNAKIADDAIDTPQIADGAVDTINIADLNVDTGKINNNAVTTAKIAADAVTGAKIADDAINSEHYTDGSIDTAHIGDDQVTTAKIPDEAITLAKLEHGTSSNDGKFLRANNGADPTFETVDLANLNASNLTSGTVPDARFPATLPAISGANLTNLPGGGKITRVFTDTGGTAQAGGVASPGSEYMSVTVNNVTSNSRYLIFAKYSHRCIGSNSQWYSYATFSYSGGSVTSGPLSGTQGGGTTSSATRDGFAFDSASNTTDRTYGIYHRSSTTSSSGRSECSSGFMVVLELDVS